MTVEELNAGLLTLTQKLYSDDAVNKRVRRFFKRKKELSAPRIMASAPVKDMESKNTIFPKVKEKTCQMISTPRLLFNREESLNSRSSTATVPLGQSS